MKRLIFFIALKIVSKRINKSKTPLTAAYLEQLGFVSKVNKQHGTIEYFEPNIRERDRIYITFSHHYYRVLHGPYKSFIALGRSKEWFETYYLLHVGKIKDFTLPITASAIHQPLF